MMPVTRRIRFATRPRRIAWMSGMPPATLPSNPSETRFCSAFATSSSQCVERSALLAVTTCLPVLHRGEDEAAGRLDAADELHDDLDLGVVHDRSFASVVNTPGRQPEPLRARDGSRSAARASSNGHAEAALDERAVLAAGSPTVPGADVPEPEDARP